MNSKFLNKKILIPLLCGIGCFTLTFLLTKAINHDEGKSLEITSRNKKLLSNLEEIDLEIISLKKQILGAKEEISSLKSQKENEVENKFFSDLTQALIECCKVEDSEALLNSELDTMLREVEMNLQQQGLSFELYEQFTGKNKDAIKADLTDQAKDRVKLNLILAAIVEAENIEVTDEERNSELETIANTYNRDLEEIKQIFAQNMYQIDADILNRKALDVVKENLKK